MPRLLSITILVSIRRVLACVGVLSCFCLLGLLCVGCGGDDDSDDNGAAGAGAAGSTPAGGSAGEGATCVANNVCDSSCADDPDCALDAAAAGAGGDSGQSGTGGGAGQSGTGGAASCSPSCGSDEFCNRLSGICVSLEPEWVAIPGATFQMGSEEERSEQPVHSVTVPAFEMLKTEVTALQYARCVAEASCSAPTVSAARGTWGTTGPKQSHENHPMNLVNRDMAREFCQWLGGRLPSEAEWEYAAKSAGKDIIYPWGNETPTCDHAVMQEFDVGRGCGTNATMEVCSKPLGNTEQGLCDMAGNVSEWVEDDYHTGYEDAPTDGSAWTDTPRNDRGVLRGANLIAGPPRLRTSYRGNPAATNASDLNGIRCAR